MSIASRITEINSHLLDDYSVLTLAGADLTNVDKNIVNLKETWQERLLYFMNNGTDVVWNNWNKATGSGTEITLNNTLEAKMKIELKGNTYQDSTTGKNKLGYTLAKLKTYNTAGTWNNNVYSYNNLTFTVNDDMSVTVNGNANANTAFNLMGGTNEFVDLNIENGNYILSGSTGGAVDMSTWCVYLGIKHNDNTTATIFSYNGDISFNKISGDTFFPLIRIGSGTVLNNVKFYPMIRISTATSEYEEPTGGIPSPNPDYPQDIHVVSGDNSIKVEGKNLADITQIENRVSPSLTIANDTITITNNSSTVGYCSTLKKLSELCPSLKVGDTAYLFFNTTSNSQYKNIVYIGQDWNNGASKTITQTMLDATVVLYGGYNETAVISNFMITKVNNNSYQPYQSQTYPISLGDMELCKIGDYQDYIGKSTGKNLTDMTTYAGGNIGSNGETSAGGVSNFSYNNGTITFTTTSTYRGTYSDYIEVKGNTVHTLSYTKTTSGVSYFSYLNYYDSSKTFISRNDISRSGKDTTPSNCKYIRILIGITTTATASVSNVMLNEGSTALPYEPYGTGWYKYGAVGKQTLVSNWWQLYSKIGQAPRRFGLSGTKWFDNGLPLMCNCLIAGDYNSQVDLSIWTQTGYLAITDKNSYWEDANALITWLNNNDTTLYYPLATPTYTPITDSTLIGQLDTIKKSYNEQTNISQTNDDLPFYLDVVALEELS